jgi:plasmid maintenance system antidote protein VapI
MKVSNALRLKIEGATVSRYAIAKTTGIQQATLSRFIHGQRGLDGKSIDKLAKFFGLELRPVRQKRKGR